MQLSSNVLVACGLLALAHAAHVVHLGQRVSHVDKPEQRSLRAREHKLSPKAQALLGGRDLSKLDPISEMRAEMCVDMKDEHGEDFASYEDCEKFMHKTCKPGKDKEMDGDKHEASTGKGYCKSFFDEDEETTTTTTTTTLLDMNPFDKEKQKKEAEKQVKKEAVPEKKEVAEVKNEKPELETTTASPPAPAAAPAPATTTITTTAQGSWWINKMDGERPIAEQGFQGEAVKHDDKSSMVGDWGAEFGPKQGGRKNVIKLCSEHPDSDWCRYNLHKYQRKVEAKKVEPKPPKSAAKAWNGFAALFSALAMSMLLSC